MVNLYIKFFSMHLKSQMQYKASFFITVAANVLVSLGSLVGIIFMFTRFNEVAGFTFEDILLCFAILLAAFSLAETFGRGFDLFPQMLGNGEFDRALVRPRPIIFMVLSMKMEFVRVARAVTAAMIFAYVIPNSHIIWTWARVVTLILMVLCGAIVFFGLFVIYAAFTFFTIEGLEFMNIFTNGGQEHGRYPFSIYGRGVLKFLTYIVPLALVQYYPLLFLLGHEDGLFYMLVPLLATLFLIPAYGFFRFGLSRYKSTGS